MDRGRWQRIKQLVADAAARPSPERARFLAEACPDDPAMRQEVEALVASHDAAGDRFERPLAPLAAFDRAGIPQGVTLLSVGHRFGPYEIVEPIGAGGMGQVYRARDTRLGREVALKLLPQEFALTDDRIARFEREARMLASVNHSNIGAIYGLEDDPATGTRALVLELVEGESLADRIARGPMPVADVVTITAQIADALDAAHRRGIVHRDIKPANIHVVPGPTVKLLDFGIAKLLTGEEAITRTVEGAIIGTAGYMSPEQADGRAVDARSDIFSVGALLYEMISSRRAFVGESLTEVLSAIVHRNPPPLDAPPALQRIVRACLEKKPGNRFQTMRELRVALTEGAAAMKEMPPSIAVLPFANLSGDPDNEYFGDGLAEEIISALARVRGLKVIARTSAFAFRDKQADVRRIAEALDVTHVLEGSVRRSGSRVRVNAQLIAASDASHMWSQRYDRELADVFAIQDDISAAIVAALQVTFSTSTAKRRQYVPSVPAYDAYLKARYDYAKATPETAARARECLEQAIAIDPTFALAHAQLGMLFFAMYRWGLKSAHEAVPLARTHARAALEIDCALPEAHNVLGCMAAMYDYDWTGAERHFQLAFARDSVAPLQARIERANFFLAHVGRGEEAVEDMRQALTEDPLNMFARWTLAVCLRAARRDAEADRRYREVLELDGGIRSTYSAIVLSGNHLERGAIEDALRFAEIGYDRAPWHPVAVGQLAGMLARTGDSARSQSLVAQLGSGDAFGAPFGLALYRLAAGDVDGAVSWLEKSIAQRDIWVPFFLRVGNLGGRVMWTTPQWPRLAKMINVA
jgi:serine/threonine-protein kinase